jgi:hypothetical protein
MKIRIARLGLAHGERLSDALCESLADEVRFRVEEERKRCLTLIERCKVMYERERDRPGLPYKVEACEYMTLVVEKVDVDSNEMPIPF